MCLTVVDHYCRPLRSDELGALGDGFHGSARLHQIQKDADSARSQTLSMACDLILPVMPRQERNLVRDEVGKPRQPTSMQKKWTRQPALSHTTTKSSYFLLFLSCASRMFLSNGTVSSPIITCCWESDHKTMSGRSLVSAMWLGKTKDRSRSTRTTQSAVPASTLRGAYLAF